MNLIEARKSLNRYKRPLWKSYRDPRYDGMSDPYYPCDIDADDYILEPETKMEKSLDELKAEYAALGDEIKRREEPELARCGCGGKGILICDDNGIKAVYRIFCEKCHIETRKYLSVKDVNSSWQSSMSRPKLGLWVTICGDVKIITDSNPFIAKRRNHMLVQKSSHIDLLTADMTSESEPRQI